MNVNGARTGRSYHQFCAVARALDLVGERWTLLLVRELILGPKRFKDLLEGLPGIGTNLLASRLKDLDREGIIHRRVLPPPAGSTVYELTEAGQGLEPVVLALGAWGRNFLGAVRPDDAVNPAWFLVSLRATFHPEAAADIRETYHLTIDGRDFTIRVNRGAFAVTEEALPDADMHLMTDFQTFRALLRYRVSAEDALHAGRVTLAGDEAAFHRFITLFASQPQPAAPSHASGA
jgi:DNA-binding HxlR family transcriptional regulator